MAGKHGGARKGAGRKPKTTKNDKKPRTFRVDDSEYAWLRELLDTRRRGSIEPGNAL